MSARRKGSQLRRVNEMRYGHLVTRICEHLLAHLRESCCLPVCIPELAQRLQCRLSTPQVSTAAPPAHAHAPSTVSASTFSRICETAAACLSALLSLLSVCYVVPTTIPRHHRIGWHTRQGRANRRKGGMTHRRRVQHGARVLSSTAPVMI